MRFIKFGMLFLPFLFLSCDDFLQCLIDRRPVLSNNEFPIAVAGEPYYADLTSQIQNEPRDNDYDYFFEIASPIPPGLDYFANYRTLSIEGTPEEPGTYRIIVNVFVDGPYRDDFIEDENVLCEYSASKTYLIIVE